MSIKPDRIIPEEIIRKVRILELKGLDRFNRKQFDEARRFYNEILELLTKTQERVGRPIHKGTPYYMIGLSFTGKNQHNEALKFITLAYIEDTLNVLIDKEDEADRTPAGQMLSNFYYVNPNFLKEIKLYVNKKKHDSLWSRLYDPQEILSVILNKLNIHVDKLLEKLLQPSEEIRTTPTTQLFGFPEPWERRVFVGGSYRTHMPVLREIESVVDTLGYTPVIAFDIQISRDQTHHHTLLLLHTCKYAIFEVSTPAGQYMEIERTIDYGTKVLVLYSTMTQNDDPSDFVSSMLRTMEDIEIKGYSDIKEIESLVSEFLQ